MRLVAEVESFKAYSLPDRDYSLELRLTREQAEMLFEDLFVALFTPEGDREPS